MFFFWKIVNFGYKNYAIFFRILVRPSKLCLMKCLSKLTRFIIMKRNRYILSVSFLYSKNLVKFWSISPKHFLKHNKSSSQNKCLWLTTTLDWMDLTNSRIFLVSGSEYGPGPEYVSIQFSWVPLWMWSGVKASAQW